MGSFAELSLGDVMRALGRYRPVAVTVVAILVALAVLPKPDRPAGLASTTGGGISTPIDSSSSAGSSAAAAGVGGAAGSSVDGGVTSTAFSPSVTSGATSFPSFTSGSSFSSGSSSSSFSSFDSGSSSGDSSGSSSSTDLGSISSGTSTVDTTNGPVTAKPLQVVGRTWWSRASGTPLAAQGVPSGTLPVGVQATDDKQSFVRLAGDGTALGFAEHPDGARENNGPVKVQACKVTEDWADGEAIGLADRPTFDTTKCVQGERSASGVWLFDLSSFPDRTDAKGFALVPGAGAGIDFQVAFRL